MKSIFEFFGLFLVICCFAGKLSAQPKFHFKAIVADTHNDVLSSATMKGKNIDADWTGKTHSDVQRFKKGGVDIQIFSIFCDERKQNPYLFALEEIDSLDAITARNPSDMQLAFTSKDILFAIQNKKLAVLKGVEGGHMIEDDLTKLENLYKRGARYLTLTWNNSTAWATSAADETKNNLPLGTKGLTAFGKQVVQRMNQLGMMVDVSHVGEQTFWDVMAIARKPVIASHSCVYNLCPVPRNLKDDQIKAIAKNGGVIFLNFYSGFLDSTFAARKNIFVNNHRTERDSLRKLNWASYEIEEWLSAKYPSESEGLRPSLEILLKHLDYIVKLVGINHVGLGSDFDGIDSAPIGLNGVQDFPLITEALLKRGYTKKQVRKILGENFLRVFKANER